MTNGSNSFPDDSEGSSLGRREYLYAVGLLAGSAGINTLSEPAEGAVESIETSLFSLSIDPTWEKVETSRSLSDPVVIVGPLSNKGPEPAHSRLREITGSSFEIALEEWAYLDGNHWDESASCLVTGAGAYSLESENGLVVGTVETDHDWTSVSFPSSLSATPVVFSEVQTYNGPDPVVTRQRDASKSGFSVRVQEEESRGHHIHESVGYLAIEPGTGTLNGRQFEAGLQDHENGEWKEITFANTYQDPLLFVDKQTFRGPNPCSVRYRNLTASDAEVRIQEEASKDKETTHKAGEQIGYLVIEGATDSDEPTESPDSPDVTDGFGGEEFGTGEFGV